MSKCPPILLSLAALNAPPPGPHPDSEEAVRSETHRTAQELDTIREHGAETVTYDEFSSPKPPSAPGSPAIRSSSTGQPPSEMSTVSDSLRPEEHHGRRYRLSRQVPSWYHPVVEFWTAHVNVTISEGAHRDHLALERTFLAYLRTSLTFAMSGVITAQLFRLQHTIHPNSEFGFFRLGVPLASIFIGLGIVVLLIGAYRFWRQQNAMIRGKVYAGGWELVCIMGLSILVCTAAFALVTAVDGLKSYL